MAPGSLAGLFRGANRDNLPWDHICWAAENVKPILSKYPQYPGTQPPPTAAGQVHGDGRTLTAADKWHWNVFVCIGNSIHEYPMNTFRYCKTGTACCRCIRTLAAFNLHLGAIRNGCHVIILFVDIELHAFFQYNTPEKLTLWTTPYSYHTEHPEFWVVCGKQLVCSISVSVLVLVFCCCKVAVIDGAWLWHSSARQADSSHQPAGPEVITTKAAQKYLEHVIKIFNI